MMLILSEYLVSIRVVDYSSLRLLSENKIEKETVRIGKYIPSSAKDRAEWAGWQKSTVTRAKAMVTAVRSCSGQDVWWRSPSARELRPSLAGSSMQRPYSPPAQRQGLEVQRQEEALTVSLSPMPDRAFLSSLMSC